MHSPKTACAAIALLLMLLAGCASSPPAPPHRADAPAELMTPAPPQGYFVTTLERILSRSPQKRTE